MNADDEIRRLLDIALENDIGPGDVTAARIIGRDQRVTAVFVTRSAGVVAGIDEVEYMAEKLGLGFRALKRDGGDMGSGDELAVVEGRAYDVLCAERTALNVLARMSAIASETRDWCSHGVPVAATRKTPPGCLFLDKKAVRIGGGLTHRMALWDKTLVKDTHLECLRTRGLSHHEAFQDAVTRGERPVEVEVESEDDALFVAGLGADIIMLDNFSPEKAKAIIPKLRSISPCVRVELSGGITRDNIREYAACGADFVSSSAITAAVVPLDMTMRVQE
ncbi:MAG: carboxylating nicotinate-nucleotide diphosphorylase [Candidatus Diapherotrites archaeon]|nr:carboxylating nicotinate-nucleotide diphosphorylase [Candidatus Diapherotrites archaeon]